MHVYFCGQVHVVACCTAVFMVSMVELIGHHWAAKLL